MPDRQSKPESPSENRSHGSSNESHGVVDRRLGLDRRQLHDLDGSGEESDTHLERRRGPGRRRTDFTRAAEEGEMTREQFNFLVAIDTFKQVNQKTFPTWTDVLEIVRRLGYRKTMPSEINLMGRVEDWTERPDASAGVDTKPGVDEEAA